VGLSPLLQYSLLLGLVVGTIGFTLTLHLIARSLGHIRREKVKNVPFTGGTLSSQPVWVRYHYHYYGFALLFLAFDMEMAFMYPWAVVYQELGLTALLDMGVFLLILFLGLLYAWSQGAFKRQ
jgi:NADH-quinone oxidoreductase subunit A